MVSFRMKGVKVSERPSRSWTTLTYVIMRPKTCFCRVSLDNTWSPRVWSDLGYGPVLIMLWRVFVQTIRFSQFTLRQCIWELCLGEGCSRYAVVSHESLHDYRCLRQSYYVTVGGFAKPRDGNIFFSLGGYLLKVRFRLFGWTKSHVEIITPVHNRTWGQRFPRLSAFLRKCLLESLSLLICEGCIWKCKALKSRLSPVCFASTAIALALLRKWKSTSLNAKAKKRMFAKFMSFDLPVPLDWLSLHICPLIRPSYGLVPRGCR